jgi:hypothetical protein
MYKPSNVPSNLFPERKSATSRLTASTNRNGICEKHTGLLPTTSLQLVYPPTGVIQKEIQLHQIVVFWVATTQYYCDPKERLGGTGCLHLQERSDP